MVSLIIVFLNIFLGEAFWFFHTDYLHSCAQRQDDDLLAQLPGSGSDGGPRGDILAEAARPPDGPAEPLHAHARHLVLQCATVQPAATPSQLRDLYDSGLNT